MAHCPGSLARWVAGRTEGRESFYLFFQSFLHRGGSGGSGQWVRVGLGVLCVGGGPFLGLRGLDDRLSR